MGIPNARVVRIQQEEIDNVDDLVDIDKDNKGGRKRNIEKNKNENKNKTKNKGSNQVPTDLTMPSFDLATLIQDVEAG